MTDEHNKSQPDDMSEQGSSADNDGGPVSDYLGGSNGTSGDAATNTMKPDEGGNSTDEEKPGA